MTKQIMLVLISFSITALGFFISLRPEMVAVKLKKFYSNYPLVHYADEQQLTSRLFFVRLIGWVLILLGLLSLYTII